MGYLEPMGTFARLAEPHAKHRGEPGRLAEEQAALRRVATLVAAGAPPAKVFDAVTAEVAALIPADSSALTRFETDGTFTPLSGWGIEGGQKHVGSRFPREGTVSGYAPYYGNGYGYGSGYRYGYGVRRGYYGGARYGMRTGGGVPSGDEKPPRSIVMLRTAPPVARFV